MKVFQKRPERMICGSGFAEIDEVKGQIGCCDYADNALSGGQIFINQIDSAIIVQHDLKRVLAEIELVLAEKLRDPKPGNDYPVA